MGQPAAAIHGFSRGVMIILASTPGGFSCGWEQGAIVSTIYGFSHGLHFWRQGARGRCVRVRLRYVKSIYRVILFLFVLLVLTQGNLEDVRVTGVDDGHH
jgi:hypothetical protein